MQRGYQLAIGQDGRNLTLPTGPTQIAGITVDNPSGSWLSITPVQDFVPPYTLGWARTISPATLSVDVIWSDSPTGTPSEQVGEPATVTLYDLPQAYSPGYASGAQQAQSPIGTEVQVEVNTPFAIEAPTTFPMVVSTGVDRIIPIRYYGAYTIGEIPGPRGLVGLTLIHQHNPGDPIFRDAIINISPQSPSFDFTFTPGIKLPPGDTLFVATESEPGSGRHDLVTTLQYYIQRGG